VIFVVADYLISVVSYGLFYQYRKYLLDEELTGITNKLIYVSLIVGLFWVIIYWAWGFYERVHRRSRLKDAFSLVVSTLFGVIILFFLLLLDDVGVKNYTQYYLTFSALFGIQLVMILIEKFALMTWLKNQMIQGKIQFNSLLIGAGAVAEEMLEELSKFHRYLGLNIIGVIYPEEGEYNPKLNLRDFGNLENLEKVIRRTNAEEIIIALESENYHLLAKIMDRLAGIDVKISVTPDIYQILLGSVKVSHFFGTPLIEIKQELMPGWQKVLKRAMDISLSMLILIIGSPFILIFALITSLSSKGPVFFQQERVGFKGRKFNIYKFRSMYVDAEKNGPALSSKDDPRITPWGRFMRKTRIDEIPQFWNVLKGDMSIVGPRPERDFFIDQIMKQAPHYRHLHKVKPGITSLGQIKVGYAENVEQMVKRLKYDIIYMENMSIALDLRILFFTIFIILQGRGK
jgi:exopolysaccharide biosynthesis polyprenyl glycosylphosphotransferase